MSSQWAQNARVAEILKIIDMNGKGMEPEKGRNLEAYRAGYDNLKSKEAETMPELAGPSFNHDGHYLPLHKQLKAAREAKGVSLRKLGELSGICFSQLWKYEQGRVSPNVSTIEKIGEVLGFTLCLK